MEYQEHRLQLKRGVYPKAAGRGASHAAISHHQLDSGRAGATRSVFVDFSWDYIYDYIIINKYIVIFLVSSPGLKRFISWFVRTRNSRPL